MRRSALRVRIEERAKERCEYCHAPQSACGYPFHIEHIICRAKEGSDEEENKALSCSTCNLAKAKRITGKDPETQGNGFVIQSAHANLGRTFSVEHSGIRSCWIDIYRACNDHHFGYEP